MSASLVESLVPRLKDLARGAHVRVYRNKGREFGSSLSLAVSEIFDAIGERYRESVKVRGTGIRADFKVRGTYLFVDRVLSDAEIGRLRRSGAKCVLLVESSERSDVLDSGVRIVRLGTAQGGRVQSIFLDDPSFNFDYAHILPDTQKCSVMHGHTSSALVEIIGHPRDGMVVDFGVAKDIIRQSIRSLDHKLFINQKYVKSESRTHVTLAFKTVHGDFTIEAPRGTTVLLEGEATVENLAQEVLSRITPKMPRNVTAVGVYVYEGLNKGTHLLAQIHQREDEKRRRTR